MRRKCFYLQVVYYSVKNTCKYFVQSPVWNKQPYVVTDPSCHSSLVGVALGLDIWMLPPSTPDLELCLRPWTLGWLWLTWRTWNSFSFTWGKNSLVWVYCFLAPEGDKGLKAKQASLGPLTMSRHHRPAAHADLWFDSWRIQGWPGHRPASGSSPESCTEGAMYFQWQFHSWINVKRNLINGKLKERYVWCNKYLGFVTSSLEFSEW